MLRVVQQLAVAALLLAVGQPSSIDAQTLGTTAQRISREQPEPDPPSPRRSASASLTVAGGGGASLTVAGGGVDIGVTKSVDDAAPNEGDTLTYTVVTSNGGPAPATGVAVSDALPAGVTFVSSTATQGSYDDPSGIWTLGSVAAMAADTLTIAATVDPGTAGLTIVNAANVSAVDQIDGNALNDSDSASITVMSVDLAVTKTVDDAAPNEGDTILYTLIVANAGPDTATGVEIADTLPTGVTFASSVETQGSYDDVGGVWTVGSIAMAAADTLEITATVDAGTAGQTIDNTASVSAVDQADTDGANDSDFASLTVLAVDIVVGKAVDDAGPNEGDTILYTILAANAGPDTATGLVIADALPAGVTFVSATATQGSYDDVGGTWTVGSILAADGDTLTISATVDGGAAGQTIDNTASVSAVDQTDTDPGNDSDSASVTILAVDLAVGKTVDDAEPNEGDTIVYTVAVANAGPDAATSVEIAEALPAGVTFVSSVETQGSYDDVGGVWTIGSIAAAAADTLTITATLDGGTAGLAIVNTASVSSLEEADTNAANDADSASVTVGTIDLAVTKAVDDAMPDEGGTIVYTVVVSNAGPGSATGLEIADALPAGVTFVTSTETQGSYDDGGGVWTVGSVAAAAADTLEITATVDPGTAGQTIDNTANVSAVNELDGNPANDSDSALLTVTSVDLGVGKTVDDDAPYEGETITYTVVVGNAGPDPATGVEIADALPAGVTFVSSTATQGSYDDVGGTWPVGSIAVAAADTLTITATVDAATAGQTIVNTASVSALDQADPNAANDSSDASLTVAAVDLGVTKAVDDTAPNEGDTIVYTVVSGNAGPDPATGVEIGDLLPGGVTFVSSTVTQGSYDDVTGAWVVGTVGAAAADTLTITATVDIATAGQTIVNAASVSTVDQLDGNAANDSDSAALTVVSADLGVSKTVDDNSPFEGDTVVFTVLLGNSGPDPATGVELSDPLPAGLTFVSSTVTKGTYDDGTGVWTVGPMAVSETDTLTITATVDAGTAGSVLVNTATVSASDQGDPLSFNDSSQASVTVQSYGPNAVTISTASLARIHPQDSLDVRVSILDSSGDRVPDEGVLLSVTTLAGFGTLTSPILQPDTSYALTFVADSIAGANVDTLEAFDPEAAAIDRDSLVVEVTDHAIISSVLDVLNDQGKQVRVIWERDLRDNASEANPIEEYVTWRRVDGFASQAGRRSVELESLDRAVLRSTADQPEGEPPILLRHRGTLWEPVGPVVPAVHFDSYASVVPTLVDSTASGGLVYSVFFVSAHTESAQVFYNSAPDSGYSVDNLAPAAPTALTLINPLLSWDEAPEPDFNAFTVYGSDTGDLQGATQIGVVTAPLLDVTGSLYLYYLVTTSDFSGNESDASSVTNPATSSPATTFLPATHLFYPPRPTPFRDRTVLVFDLPQPERVRLSVFDVTGRLVRTLADGPRPAGRHEATWTGRDDSGRSVSAGVYFLRLEAGPYRQVQKIVRLRSQ